MSVTSSPRMKPIRNKLTAAAAACALLGAAGMLSSSAASASAISPGRSGAALRAALRGDLSHYLSTRHKAEHISAVSLRVTYARDKPAINLAAGTTRYAGGPPAATSALWQVGSNTKAFTAVIVLQLEAEGKLSINDPLGRWLPQYRAWRDVTIKQLLNMTSRIPNYADQPAFATALAKDPGTRFTAARLVSYAVGVPLAPKGFYYSDTNYILAQMIIARVTHDSFADQLTKRIITPLRLHDLCYAPSTCPPADAARMPAGYFFEAGAPPLLASPCPVSPSPGPRPPAASSARWPTSPPGSGPSTRARNCRQPSSASSKASSRRPPASPSAPPPRPTRMATRSASPSSPTSRSEPCGGTAAARSATGSSISTSPAPA